jgi:hypothetical protein
VASVTAFTPDRPVRRFYDNLKAFVSFVGFLLDTGFGLYKNERNLSHHVGAWQKTTLTP